MQKSTPDNQKVLTATVISDKVDLETNNISRDRERRRQPVPVGGRRVAPVCEMAWIVPATGSGSLLPSFSLFKWEESEINRDDLRVIEYKAPKFPDSRKPEGQPRWVRLLMTAVDGVMWERVIPWVVPLKLPEGLPGHPEDLALHYRQHTPVGCLQRSGTVLNKCPTCRIPFVPPFNLMRSTLLMGN